MLTPVSQNLPGEQPIGTSQLDRVLARPRREHWRQRNNGYWSLSMQSATFFWKPALAHIPPADCLKTADEDMRPCTSATAFRCTALPKCVALPEMSRNSHRWSKSARPPGADRGARGGHRSLRRRHARPERAAAFDCQDDAHSGSRSACLHGAGATGRAKSGHQRGGRATQALLRARSVIADCLHHRRQCGGKLWRRALPEVRPDRAQHPSCAWC